MNNTIITEFNKLVKQIQYEIDHESDPKKRKNNTFRLQNIKKARDFIVKYPKNIDDVKQLTNIPGFGTGILKRIDEIIRTGYLSEIKQNIVDDQYSAYLDELENVFGIGRKMAIDLLNNHDIKSIADLKKKFDQGVINLPDNVVKGLKYYDLIKHNIPRQEIDLIYELLCNNLDLINPNLFGTICGSYRRLNMTSGDIDFLLIHPDIKTINDLDNNTMFANYLDKLIDIKFIVDSFTTTNVKSKFMGLCRLSNNYPIRRIDIRFIPFESYYYALLYFTGSMNFNRKMRRIAIDNNFILNEYGLFDSDGKMMSVDSEKDIFDILYMEYITPDSRNI